MKPIILIKTGGKVAVIGHELTSLIKEINILKDDFSFVLIHGGGAEVTEVSEFYGLKTKFINGIRMTTKPEMKIADGVLAGIINKRLVRNFETLGLPAVGLSGSDGRIFTGESITPDSDNRTGRITKTDPTLLYTLMEAGFIPLISSVSMDKNGNALNINADEAALAISKSIKANKVIFISDIPGILKDGKIIEKMNPESVISEIKSGVISGGMIPKVNSAIDAIKNGIESVVISNYMESGDLKKLINNKKGSLLIMKKEIL